MERGGRFKGKTMKLHHLSACVTCFLLTPVHAEDQSTQLADIVVSASRFAEPDIDTTASIRVLAREAIEQSGATNITDLLRGRAGIHINDLYGDGSRATIDMRGFGPRANSNVLVMVDGRKLNSSTDAPNLFFNEIPLDQVERVEVIYGSSGVMFGNQAVGGVVNIITRRVENDSPARLALGAGSYGKRSAELTLNHLTESGLGIRTNIRTLHSDGYRDHNNSNIINLNLLLDYENASTRYFFEHRYLDESVENPGALFLDELATDRRQADTNYLNDFTDTRSHVSRLGVEHNINERWQLLADATLRRDNVDFRLSSRFGVRPQIDTQEREIATVSPRISGRLPMQHGNMRVTVGADIERTDYTIDALLTQHADQMISAAYAQVTYPLTDALDVTLGARHAQVENDIVSGVGNPAFAVLDLDDSATVGTLGLSFRPDHDWRWFARIDQNYRFAKLEEHTADTAAATFPNPPVGLKNQRGISIEGGIEYNTRTTSLTFQAYQLRLKDEISFDSTVGFSGANVNLDKTTRNGLNIGLSQALNDQLNTTIDIDLIDGEITAGAHDGNRIPMVPEHQLRLALDWQPAEKWRAGAEILHIGEQVLSGDFANTFRELDAYTVVNLNVNYRVDRWTFRTKIANLFDRKYSEFGAPGFSSAGVHPQCVGLTCPAFTPSPERHFWLGAEYRLED